MLKANGCPDHPYFGEPVKVNEAAKPQQLSSTSSLIQAFVVDMGVDFLLVCLDGSIYLYLEEDVCVDALQKGCFFLLAYAHT